MGRHCERARSAGWLTRVGLIAVFTVAATACNGDNPLAVDGLVDESAEGECPGLLQAIREEAAADVGPYGLVEQGELAEGFAGVDVFLGDAFGSWSDPVSPRAALVGGTASEADLLAVVSDGRLYIVDIGPDSPGVVGSVPLGLQSPLSFDSGPQRITGASLFVVGSTATVVFPQVGDPPEQLKLTSDPFGSGYGAGAAVRVDLTDPSAPRVIETLYFGGRVTAISPSAAPGDTGGGTPPAELTLSLSAPPPPLPMVQPMNAAAEDTAESVNRKVVEDSTLEDWVAQYALERGGRVVDSGPIAGCSLQRIPDSSLASPSALAVRLPTEGQLTAFDAVSILGAGAVLASGDHLMARGGSDGTGTQMLGFSWDGSEIEGIGQVRVEGGFESMPEVIGDGAAVVRTVDWNSMVPEATLALLTASERGLRLDELIAATSDQFGPVATSPVRVGDLIVVSIGSTVVLLEADGAGSFRVAGSIDVGLTEGRLQSLGESRLLVVGMEESRTMAALLDVSDPAEPEITFRSELPWVDSNPSTVAVHDRASDRLVLPRLEIGSAAGSLQVVAEVDGELVPTGIVRYVEDPPPGMGDTECEEIGFDRIENQLEMFGQAGSLNVLCEGTEATGVVGHSCSALPAAVLEPDFMAQFGGVPDGGGRRDVGPLAELRLAVEEGARIESCVPWDFGLGSSPDYMTVRGGRVFAVSGPQVRIIDLDALEMIDSIQLQPTVG